MASSSACTGGGLGAARASAISRAQAVSIFSWMTRARLGAGQTRRDRVQDLDHNRARIAHEAAPGPEQARVERQRHAGQAEAFIERKVARLVVGRRFRREARTLGKDDDLASLGGTIARIADQGPQGAGAFVAPDEDVLELVAEPAVKRNPAEFRFHHHGRVAEDRDQREGIPGRLMLGGDQASAGRQLLAAAHLHMRAADHLEPPQTGEAVQPQSLHGPAARGQQQPAAEHQEQGGVDVEDRKVGKRPEQHHGCALTGRRRAMSRRRTHCFPSAQGAQRRSGRPTAGI